MNSTYKISTFEKEGILEIVITGVVTRSCYENVENEFDTIVNSMTVRNLLLDVREVKGRVGYFRRLFSCQKLFLQSSY